MKTILAAILCLVSPLQAAETSYAEVVAEMKSYADRHAAARPRHSIHDIYRTGMDYAQQMFDAGHITPAELAETRENYWIYLQRAYNVRLPRPRKLTEADIAAIREQQAAEERAKALEKRLRDLQTAIEFESQRRFFEE